MFNKDTPKHETRVSCVGRVSTSHSCQLWALFHVNWDSFWFDVFRQPLRLLQALLNALLAQERAS